MASHGGDRIPWFPTDYIFGCIDDREEAQAAERELRDAGFHAEDVRLLSGEEATQEIHAACEQCNFLVRTLRSLWQFMTDEGIVFHDYADEAKARHNIIAVHVQDRGRVREASDILHRHDAHRVEHFSHGGTMTELTP